MEYFSDDRQDEFVANLLKFKKDGFYLDIGSCASVGSNNSYFFDLLGWKGICIEKNPMFNDSYKQRSCVYLNEDALTIDYEKLFIEKNVPLSIDYLSLDIDENSVDALRKLPLSKHRFKVITIEHDSHVHGDLYKKPQRMLLGSHNYFLLGEDVLNQSGLNIRQEHAWEDWWVDASYFSRTEMVKLYSFRLDTKSIIEKIKRLQK